MYLGETMKLPSFFMPLDDLIKSSARKATHEFRKEVGIEETEEERAAKKIAKVITR